MVPLLLIFLFLIVFFLLLLLFGCWCFLSLLRRKGTTSSPQMVVWNKQNPLEEHLSHPLNEARSSSSSSSNQSEHCVTRTGSSPLAVPGRRWVTSNNSIIQSKFACYLVFLHTTNLSNANFGWSPEAWCFHHHIAHEPTPVVKILFRLACWFILKVSERMMQHYFAF